MKYSRNQEFCSNVKFPQNSEKSNRKYTHQNASNNRVYAPNSNNRQNDSQYNRRVNPVYASQMAEDQEMDRRANNQMMEDRNLMRNQMLYQQNRNRSSYPDQVSNYSQQNSNYYYQEINQRPPPQYQIQQFPQYQQYPSYYQPPITYNPYANFMPPPQPAPVYITVPTQQPIYYTQPQPQPTVVIQQPQFMEEKRVKKPKKEEKRAERTSVTVNRSETINAHNDISIKSTQMVLMEQIEMLAIAEEITTIERSILEAKVLSDVQFMVKAINEYLS